MRVVWVQRRAVWLLYRAASERPRRQWALAFGVSAWTLAWISGQFVVPDDTWTALRVVRGVLSPLAVDVPGPVVELSGWLQEPEHQVVAVSLALAGGLLWAATAERAQLPALGGWLTVMLAGEGIGYRAAVSWATLALAGFVLVALVVSLPGRSFVDRRAKLMPSDVLRAGTTAAVLTAVVPLLAPGALLARLWRPYVTRPPRPVDSTSRDDAPSVDIPHQPCAPAERRDPAAVRIARFDKRDRG